MSMRLRSRHRANSASHGCGGPHWPPSFSSCGVHGAGMRGNSVPDRDIASSAGELERLRVTVPVQQLVLPLLPGWQQMEGTIDLLDRDGAAGSCAPRRTLVSRSVSHHHARRRRRCALSSLVSARSRPRCRPNRRFAPSAAGPRPSGSSIGKIALSVDVPSPHGCSPPPIWSTSPRTCGSSLRPSSQEPAMLGSRPACVGHDAGSLGSPSSSASSAQSELAAPSGALRGVDVAGKHEHAVLAELGQLRGGEGH